MADRFKAASMDVTGAKDVHKRYELFEQKCRLISDGQHTGPDECYSNGVRQRS